MHNLKQDMKLYKQMFLTVELELDRIDKTNKVKLLSFCGNDINMYNEFISMIEDEDNISNNQIKLCGNFIMLYSGYKAIYDAIYKIKEPEYIIFENTARDTFEQICGKIYNGKTYTRNKSNVYERKTSTFKTKYLDSNGSEWNSPPDTKERYNEYMKRLSVIF